MINKKILLTGGSGMVGQNLLEYFGAKHFDVLAPTRRELDLGNFEAVFAYIQKSNPDIVIHAAGKVGGIQANIREPVNFLIENLDIGRNVVLSSYKIGVKHLLNLGSSCMYPKGYAEPLEEEMILDGGLEPTNEGYALAKIVTARLCDYISRQDENYHYKTIIPCNLYGRYDKFSPADSHLIPAIIHKLHEAKKNNDKYVEIWGDGSARREFMYAGDLAEMIFKMIEDFKSLPSYMNIGLGYDCTINQYYEEAAKVIGFKGNFVHDLTKPVGMLRKLVNVNKQTQWGWKHKTDLKEGLKKTYEYYLEGLIQ